MAANSIYWVHKKAEQGLLDGVKPLSRLVLFALAGYADLHKEAWPTLEQLAKMTGISERTVGALVDDLIDRGFLSKRRGVHPKRKKNRRQTNIYTLVFIPDIVAQREAEDAEQPALLDVREDLQDIDLPKWLSVSALKDVPSWFPIDVWLRWEISRKENKKPITPSARKQMISKLKKMKEEHEPYGVQYAVAVVERSIERDWQGLFDLSGNALERFYKENYTERQAEFRDVMAGYITIEYLRTHADGQKSVRTEKRKLTFDELVHEFMYSDRWYGGKSREEAEAAAREVINSRDGKKTKTPPQPPKRNATGHRELKPVNNPLAAFEEAVGAEIEPHQIDFDALDAEFGGVVS